VRHRHGLQLPGPHAHERAAQGAWRRRRGTRS
jgi:hypothetical protein